MSLCFERSISKSPIRNVIFRLISDCCFTTSISPPWTVVTLYFLFYHWQTKSLCRQAIVNCEPLKIAKIYKRISSWDAVFSSTEFVNTMLRYVKYISIWVVKAPQYIYRVYSVYKKNRTFEIQVIWKPLYKFDRTECFQLIIRKNTRSCTHGNYMKLLLSSHVYTRPCVFADH